MKRANCISLLSAALLFTLAGCIRGEAQWITAQGREVLVYVDMDKKIPDRFMVYAMGNRSEKPSAWVLPGALQTARKLGYRCLQVIETYDKLIGPEPRDYNESWLKAQASKEPCVTDYAKKRYDLNLNIQKLDPPARKQPQLEPQYQEFRTNPLPPRKDAPKPTATPIPAKPDMSQYPVLDMATIPRPKPSAASLPANLGEAIQRIEAQLAQYPEFKHTPKPRSFGMKLFDFITFYPTEPPKAIDRFETVDVPFFSKCMNGFSFFLDNDTIICGVHTNKVPPNKNGPGFYRLNYEINLRTGQVIPHPELSYDFPDLDARGDIRCYDPISQYMQIEAVSRKPGEEQIHLRGYWGGKIEAYWRDPWMINSYTCQNITNPVTDHEIGQQGIGGYTYLRDKDGLIVNSEQSYLGVEKIEKVLRERGMDNYHVYNRLVPDHRSPYLLFLDAYMVHNNKGDCIKGEGREIDFWSSQRGFWSWPIPDEITRDPKERGCNALYAQPVKPGMVWLHSPSSTNTKGINFQLWDNPGKVIKLAEGGAFPTALSPDGCKMIYAHYHEEPSSRAGMYNPDLYQYRLSNFCNPRK